jgi:hypothetical protein
MVYKDGLSPSGLMTRLNGVQGWLKRVPLTAPSWAGILVYILGLFGLYECVLPSQIPLS